MPRNRAALPGRLTRAELSEIKLTLTFDYIRTLADDFARIKQQIDAGPRAAPKRSKTVATSLESGVFDGAVGVGK
jgi:hypothetical protein